MLTQLHNYLMCYVHVHLDLKHLKKNQFIKIAENNLVFSNKLIFNKLPTALYIYETCVILFFKLFLPTQCCANELMIFKHCRNDSDLLDMRTFMCKCHEPVVFSEA